MKRIFSLAVGTLLAIGGVDALAQTATTQHVAQAAGGGHAGHGDASKMTEASKAYMEAMDKMHGPMMEGARDPDADVAFVKGMIPHHQGAIDMARIVLRHGKDAQIRKLANEVIRAQTREIAEMEAWLKKHAHKH